MLWFLCTLWSKFEHCFSLRPVYPLSAVWSVGRELESLQAIAAQLQTTVRKLQPAEVPLPPEAQGFPTPASDPGLEPAAARKFAKLEAAREVALAGETGAPVVVGAAASPEERCGLR